MTARELIARTLIISGVFYGSRSANATECAWILEANPRLSAEVRVALDSVFPESKRSLDQKFYAHLVAAITHDLASKPRSTRGGVLNALAKSQSTHQNWAHGETDRWAQIDHHPEGPRLLYHAVARPNAALMFVFAHEAVHLVRDCLYPGETDVEKFFFPSITRLSTYLSERQAIAREYDLIHAVYTRDDLTALVDRYVSPFATFMTTHPGGPDTWDEAWEWTRLWLEFNFYDSTQLALLNSRREYVAYRLQSYRNSHARIQAIRFLLALDHDPSSPEEADHLVDLITRVNLEIHRARYPHKYTSKQDL